MRMPHGCRMPLVLAFRVSLLSYSRLVIWEFIMGLVHVTVSLRASEKSRKNYEADFLVDTGTTDSMAPAKGLKKAGIKRRGRMAYELADGSTVEYDFGLAEIEFMGELTSGRVIFGPDACEPLLGVTALESVGIMVDPASRSLRRLPAVPLKMQRVV